MIPSVGRTVAYCLGEIDAQQVNRRRKDALKHQQGRMVNTGDQVHVGNESSAGDILPLIITRVWGNGEDASVNGQVVLDGTDTLWVTSVQQGSEQKQWSEFPRV